MNAFFKTRNGEILLGDYANLPSNIEYENNGEILIDIENDIPLNSYGKLTTEQIERYNEKPNDLNYIFTGVVTPEPEPTLDELKLSKLTTLNANFKEKIDLGFSFNSYLFALDDNTKINISDWNQGVEKENKLCIANENYVRKVTACQITDANGIHRYISIEDWDLFFIGFFAKLATLKSMYSFKRNNVNSAISEILLEAVNIDFPSEEEEE